MVLTAVVTEWAMKGAVVSGLETGYGGNFKFNFY
jgi:hypothetical protein